MRLLVATTNAGKLREIRPLLTNVDLVTLADLPAMPEPHETCATFWENARLKALAYARASDLTTVAEDSGLEITALNDEPGVQSARFLGDGVPYPVRFDEIYRRLAAAGLEDRSARFVTALAVARPDGAIVFETETRIEGEIASSAAGEHGFGYDPIFLYPPLGKTTGQLTISEKSGVSHRARAFRDLARWLRTTTSSSI